MRDRIAARDALLQQAQTMTLQIRTDRTILEASLTAARRFLAAARRAAKKALPVARQRLD